MKQSCEDWLKDYLSEKGATLYTTVKNAAREAGYTRGQLKAARKTLKVETISDWAANGETLNWFWSLPDRDRED